ncbi:MAG: ATP synthase F1 subunit delta [Bacteroidetes bacterium]|nr:ATP synthase F1 subunit delta [Bacteroidota bacterium]
MKETIVASRYAKSLLDLAMEQGNLEQVKEDIQLLEKAIRESRDLANFIKNPIIKTDKKTAVLKEIFDNKISPLSHSFINLITVKKREVHLYAIAKGFLTQYNTHKRIMTAVITTASGVDENTRSRVLQMVTDATKNQIELIEKIDPSLIGGFILEYGDKRINTSISQKLNRLKREFKENPYIKNF